MAAVGSGWLSAGAAATTAVAPHPIVTLTPTDSGADASWPATNSVAYYQLSVTDVATDAAFTVLTHGPFGQAHLSGLVNGDPYAVSVTAHPGDALVGTATVTPVAAPSSTLAAPALGWAVPTHLAGGAPALSVHVAAQPGARYEMAEAFSASWTPVARTVAAPSASGETLTLGPLAPDSTYHVGVAGHDSTGQGQIRWWTGTTGAAGCSLGACLAVSDAAAPEAFTANGVLDTIPSPPSTFAPLHPAMFRLNTAYGSPAGAAASAVAATGAALVENLADAWYSYSDSGLAGGAMPPWECWSCYSRFISSQARAVANEGASPAYWEIVNEPGSGSYPAHLQGDAALYLRQLQVAAAAIRQVFPAARILAPTDGSFWTGGTGVATPLLTLDAVLANAASIPGFAGLDWHENSAPTSPAIAGEDVASARTLARLAGLVGIAMVVSEYTTAQDAPLPGAQAAWLSALTQAGVTFAARACWLDQPVGTTASTCSGLLADGLFTPAGALTAPGEVTTYYGEMAGGQPRAALTSSAEVYALASAARGTVHVLVGREYANCLVAVSGSCPPGTPAPGPTRTVGVTVPMSVRPRVVTLTTVAPVGGASTPAVTNVPFSYQSGLVALRISLPDGTAGYLTLH